MLSARHAGKIERLGDDFGLALHAGREIAHFARAVVVDGGAENDGADTVAIGERIFKAAQDDDAEAARKDGAARRGVERAAVAVARKNLAFAVDVAEAVRNLDGDAAGQSHVALEVEQALAGQMHGDERRGAGGLHVDAGTAQVELIADARGQHIFVVAGLLELEQARGVDEAAIGEQIVDQVGVHARSGKDADGTRELLRRMGGVFQRLPRALQEMPVLRVHDGGVARAEAEERCVEERHIVEDGGAADVVGVGEIFRRCAGGEQLRFRKVADGLDAVAQVLPELGGRLRAPGKRPAMPTIAMAEGFMALWFPAAAPFCGARRDRRAGWPQWPPALRRDARRAR